MCTILALESSCDDTSAAVLQNGKILTNRVSGQDVHKKFGGVVPELASRAHQQNIVYVVEEALKEADISLESLDAIGFTSGPGLIGSLLVSTSFAKGLALSLNIPLIGVDHLHAHVMANFIDEPRPAFPFLCLLVSGGHTQIIKVSSFNDIEIIGQTLDDAAGEAFDKAAQVIDIPYPGGPGIDKYSQQGDPDWYSFPEPKIKKFDYSFSGLKTAFLYLVRDELKKDKKFLDKHLEDLCASYQRRIVNYLVKKLELASEHMGINKIALAGGVAANSGLRKLLDQKAAVNNWNVYYPQMQYCTDNAAMIAITAMHKYKAGNFDSQKIKAYARRD